MLFIKGIQRQAMQPVLRGWLCRELASIRLQPLKRGLPQGLPQIIATRPVKRANALHSTMEAPELLRQHWRKVSSTDNLQAFASAVEQAADPAARRRRRLLTGAQLCVLVSERRAAGRSSSSSATVVHPHGRNRRATRCVRRAPSWCRPRLGSACWRRCGTTGALRQRSGCSCHGRASLSCVLLPHLPAAVGAATTLTFCR